MYYIYIIFASRINDVHIQVSATLRWQRSVNATWRDAKVTWRHATPNRNSCCESLYEGLYEGLCVCLAKVFAKSIYIMFLNTDLKNRLYIYHVFMRKQMYMFIKYVWIAGYIIVSHIYIIFASRINDVHIQGSATLRWDYVLLILYILYMSAGASARRRRSPGANCKAVNAT